MATTSNEILNCAYQYISPQALHELRYLGIEVKQGDEGYSFSVPRTDMSWDSDDNGGSYDIVIRGKKFWLDCNGNQGVQLEGQVNSRYEA